ncbi:uncharacterized protein [Centruroides vittatus]|uniref:uncharacterized protein n=1 Tax=Centruroides vittatus TaxID=120091 RepID=UPI00351095FF
MSSRDRDAGRKSQSGSSKRKRAIKRKQVEKNLRGSLYKYINSDGQETSKNPSLTESDTLLHCNPNPAEIIPSTSSWVPLPPSNNSQDNESTTSLSHAPPPPPSTLSSQEYVSESMSTSMTGGIGNLNPQNGPGCLYYFPVECSDYKIRIGFSEGVCDWKHLGDYLKSRESSRLHKDSQTQIEQERQRWRDILERLLAIVNFLASHNLAFRGRKEKLISDSDSNDFVSKCDGSTSNRRMECI